VQNPLDPNDYEYSRALTGATILKQPAGSRWCVSTCIDVALAYILALNSHPPIQPPTVVQINGCNILVGGENDRKSGGAATRVANSQPTLRQAGRAIIGRAPGTFMATQSIDQTQIDTRFVGIPELLGKMAVNRVPQVFPTFNDHYIVSKYDIVNRNERTTNIIIKKMRKAFCAILGAMQTGNGRCLVFLSIVNFSDGLGGHALIVCGCDPDLKEITAYNPEPQYEMHVFKRDSFYYKIGNIYRVPDFYYIVTW
jgi:hypothetical protein